MSVLSKVIDESNICFQNIITEEFSVHYRARSPTLDVLEGKSLEIRTRISSYEGQTKMHWDQIRRAVRELAASGVQEISLRKAAVLMETLPSHLHPASQRVAIPGNTKSEVIYYVNELRATRLIKDETFFSSAFANKTLLVTPLNKYEVHQIWLDSSKRLPGFPLITFADTLIDLGQVHALEARYYCARYQMMKSMTKTQADDKMSKSLISWNRSLMKDIIDQGTSDGLQFKHIEVDCRHTFKKDHWPSNEIMSEWVRAIIPEEHHHKIVNVCDDLNGVSGEGGSMPQYLASRPWHTLHLFAGDDRLSRDVDSLEASHAILQNNGSTAVSLSTSPYHLREMPAAYKELMDNNNSIGHLISDPSLLSIHAKPLLFPRRIAPASKISKIALDWSSKFMTVIKSICDQRTRKEAGGEIGSLEMDTEGEAIVIFDDDMIVDLDDNSDDDITVINSDKNDEKISQSIQIKKVVGKSAFECLSKTTGIVEGDCDCSSCRDILTARSDNITHGELCICNTGTCAKTCKHIKNGESCGKATYRGDHCYEHTIKSRAENFNRDTTLKNCEHKGCINRHSPNSQFCAIHRYHHTQDRRDAEAVTEICLKESCQHRSSYGHDYCYHHRHIPFQNIINKLATLSKCKIPDCQHKCWKNTPYCYVVHNRFATQYICDENPSLQKCMIKNCNHKQYANTPFCFLKHMANRSRYNRFMETDRVSQCCVQSCEEQASNDSPYCVQAHNHLREQCLINNENTLGNCHERSCDNRVSDTELFCKVHGNKNEQGFYEQNTDNSVCIYAECDKKSVQIAPFCIESHFKQAKACLSYMNSAKCEVFECKERAGSDVPYCATRHKHRNYQWKRDQDDTLEECAVATCSHKAARGWVYCKLSHHHLEKHFRQSRANSTPECAMNRCTKASSGDTKFCTASHRKWVAIERVGPDAINCAIPSCPLKAAGTGPNCNIDHDRHNTQFFLDSDSTKPICSEKDCNYHTNEDEPFCVLEHYTQLKAFRKNKRCPAENPEAGTSAGPSKVARTN